MSEVLVWRLCASHRLPWAFSGLGSARRAGRWNQRGTHVVYCSESRSLAALEVLASADDPMWLGALEWVCIPAVIPASCIEKPTRFPETWRSYPHGTESREFGTRWAEEKRSAVLRVPSAVTSGEFNYVLNPAHDDFKEVKIGKPEPFVFDPRLARER